MSASLVERATLLFVYTYRLPEVVGAYDQNHVELARICRDHLQKLGAQSYPWDCHQDSLDSGSEFVEVKVRLVHQLYDNDSSIALPHAKQLWRALLHHFEREPSPFGGQLYSLNMHPLMLGRGVDNMSFTFGKPVIRLAGEVEPPIPLGDIKTLSARDSLQVSAELVLQIVEYSALGAAVYMSGGLYSAAGINLGLKAIAQGFDYYEQTVSIELVDQISGQIPQPLSIGEADESNEDVDQPLGLEKITQHAREFLQSPSFEAAARIAQHCADPATLYGIATSARSARTIMKSGPQQQEAREEKDRQLSKIVDATKMNMYDFELTYSAAVTRVRHLLEKEVQSAQEYYEALEVMHGTMALYLCVREGVRNLTAHLQNQRKIRNSRVATVATIGTFAVAAAMFAPVGLAAAALAYGGTGVAAASATNFAMKSVEEGRQVENLTQNNQDMEKVFMKLQFLTAAAFVTNVWKFDLERMDPQQKQSLLRSFGVDERYFSEKDYTMAHMRTALVEFERILNAVLFDMHGIILDLGIELTSLKG